MAGIAVRVLHTIGVTQLLCNPIEDHQRRLPPFDSFSRFGFGNLPK